MGFMAGKEWQRIANCLLHHCPRESPIGKASVFEMPNDWPMREHCII
jgi:hypothetical protein